MGLGLCLPRNSVSTLTHRPYFTEMLLLWRKNKNQINHHIGAHRGELAHLRSLTRAFHVRTQNTGTCNYRELQINGHISAYMPYLRWDKASQNLAHMQANFHKIFQISQNFQTILQHILWRNKHKSCLCLSQASYIWIFWGSSSDFCQKLTEFYAITLKTLPYLTDSGMYMYVSGSTESFLPPCKTTERQHPRSRTRLQVLWTSFVIEVK